MLKKGELEVVSFRLGHLDNSTLMFHCFHDCPGQLDLSALELYM